MALKIVIFLNQFNRGWTYTFFKDGSTPPSALPDLDKKAIVALGNLSNDAVAPQWVRYSVVGVPQYVRGFNIQQIGQSGTEDTWDQEGTPDVTSTDAQMYVYGENFSKRTIAIRGLDDTVVVRNQADGISVAGGVFLGALKSAIKKIVDAHWQIQRSKTPQRDALTSKNVSTIKRTPGSPQLADVAFLGDLGARPLDALNLALRGKYDKKALPFFPRNPRIYASSTIDGITTVTVNYTMPSADTVFPTSLIGYYQTFAYDNITEWEFLRFSSRDTGRPFGSSRGRKSVAIARR